MDAKYHNSEKRRFQRIPIVKIPALSSDLNFIERARIINVSESGALIDHPAFQNEGDIVMLRLWTNQEKILYLAGKIIRKAGAERYGISFIENSYWNYYMLSLKNILDAAIMIVSRTCSQEEFAERSVGLHRIHECL